MDQTANYILNRLDRLERENATLCSSFNSVTKSLIIALGVSAIIIHNKNKKIKNLENANKKEKE